MKHFKVEIKNLDGMFDHAELFRTKTEALERASEIRWDCKVFQGNYPDLTGIHGNAFSSGAEYKLN